MRNVTRFGLVVLFMALVPAIGWSGGSQEATDGPSDQPSGMSEFSEAPMLAEMVSAGDLPPVEERLPDNPYVEMAPSVGNYVRELKIGGTQPIENPWNSYVQTGTNIYAQAFEETLLNLGFPNQGENEPNLVESYEVSDDGLEITFRLREGVKWSDGVEFTTEDIMFTYNDVVLNGKINIGQRNPFREISASEPVDDNGFVDIDPDNYVRFEQIDRYTFTVITREPRVNLLNQLLTPGLWWNYMWLPKHQMTEYHPDYNDDATVEDWNNARRPGSTDEPSAVLSPWVPTEVAGGNILIMERNPYYWRVDQEGNQLPYADRMIARRYLDRESIALGMIAGEIDFYLWEQQVGQYSVLKQQEGTGDYTVYITPVTGGEHNIVFNLDTPDEGLAALFSDPRFIRAVNHAVDREEAANLFTRPLITTLWANLPSPGTSGYDEEIYSEYAASYDPDQAVSILSEMGVVDSDGDGVLEFPSDNPRAGEPIEFTVMVNTAHSDRLRTAEVAVENLQEIGLTVFLSTLDGSIFYRRLNNLQDADYEAAIYWGVNPLRPVFQPGRWAPLSEGQNADFTPLSTTPEEWRPWQNDVREIIEEALVSSVEYTEILENMKEAYPIIAERVPQISVLTNTYYFVVANKIKNNPFEDFGEVIEREGFGRVWAEGVPRHVRPWRMFY